MILLNDAITIKLKNTWIIVMATPKSSISILERNKIITSTVAIIPDHNNVLKAFATSFSASPASLMGLMLNPFSLFRLGPDVEFV